MRAFTIKISNVMSCPKSIWSVEHYRDDGACLCGPCSHGHDRKIDVQGTLLHHSGHYWQPCADTLATQ